MTSAYQLYWRYANFLPSPPPWCSFHVYMVFPLIKADLRQPFPLLPATLIQGHDLPIKGNNLATFLHVPGAALTLAWEEIGIAAPCVRTTEMPPGVIDGKLAVKNIPHR